VPITVTLNSFNTFELGVLVDDNGKIIRHGSPDRIDSVNGLMRVEQIRGKDPNRRTIDYYKRRIGDLRSIIFNTADKAKLCENIENYLGIKGIYCTFAIKCSPLDFKHN
jgi:hypothetical protein